MRTGEPQVETADGPMPLFEAIPDSLGPDSLGPDSLGPDSKPLGAVVVIQEAFGVNPHIEDITRRVAAAGYHAIAPAMFHRTGSGVVPYGDFGPVIEHFIGIGSDDSIMIDVDAALDYLRGLGFADHQIGLIGFCFGGRVSFLVSTQRAIGAAVGFYGGGIVTAPFPQFPSLIDRVPSLQTPWLGIFGDLDASIPVDDVERLRAELVGAPVATDVVRYADAEHGFNCDARPAYNAHAAADAWSRALDWFAGHLGA